MREPAYSSRSRARRANALGPRYVRGSLIAVLGLGLGGCPSPSGSSKGDGENDPAPSADAGDPKVNDGTREVAPKTDAELEKVYLRAKRKVDGDTIDAGVVAEVTAELKQVADGAKDPHLRANASLLLGSLAEAGGDRRTAISYYQQAVVLVPQEASAHAVLAMALAADGKPAEAIPVQAKVVELVPDDLQAWLIFGELHVKAGKTEEATKVYAAYEVRRKGLIDGLTLKNKDGSYIVSVEDRIGCAAALEAARDTGTAIALVYALETDPDPKVRAEVAGVMGSQRLDVYEPALTQALAKATDPEVKEVLTWALAEVKRDPVKVSQEAAPVVPSPEGDTDGDTEGERADVDTGGTGGEADDGPSSPAETPE